MMSIPCHALGRGHLDSIADSEIALQLGLCPSNLDQQENTRNQKKKKYSRGKKMDCLRIEKNPFLGKAKKGGRDTEVFSKEKGKRFNQKIYAGISCALQMGLIGQAPQKTVEPYHFSPSYRKFYLQASIKEQVALHFHHEKARVSDALYDPHQSMPWPSSK